MWECHLLSVYYLALHFILTTTESQEAKQILADIPRLPGVLAQLIEAYETKALELARTVGALKGFYTVAAGPLLSLAYKEGIITNMEFIWGHGSVIESGEFRHGPLEITEEGVPFLFLLGTDPSRHTTERALRFVKRYTKSVLVLDYQEICAGLHADLAPMLMFVPLEWLSYYLALMNNHNPDDRRYYNIVEY
jgi:fructoselysine-6-P-deglycase FrlB-like protein